MSEVRHASTNGCGSIAYTIATLVNHPTLYDGMCRSFRAGGFDGGDCEFLAAFNPADGYSSLNGLLAQARGTHVVLCHQDVRLLSDGRAALDRRLEELSVLDPDWAVAGNAGGIAPGQLAMRITDPHGADRTLGALPARVMSLDENFLVVRRAARVGFSRDLAGFHLYGADICLACDVMGYSAWVIDFHLEHLSPGRKDASFARSVEAFRAKWGKALRPRWLQTTCTLVALAGLRLPHPIVRWAERGAGAVARRRAGAATWRQQRAAAQAESR